MQRLMVSYLECSLIMAGVSLVFWLVAKALSQKVRARSLYITWIVILLGFLIPLRPTLHLPAQVPGPVEILPEPLYYEAQAAAPRTPQAPQGRGEAPRREDMFGAARENPAAVIAAVWLAGACIALACSLYRHARMLVFLSRWRKPVEDPAVLALHRRNARELGVSREVPLYLCPKIPSPMLLGLVRPAVYLPDTAADDGALELILKHELVHCARGDLWVKLMALVTRSLHWFNPVIHFAVFQMSLYCEISCDERAVRNVTALQRRDYGRAILYTVSGGVFRTILSTSFTGGKKTMKQRIVSLLKGNKKRSGAVVLAAALLVTSISAYASTGNTVAAAAVGAPTKHAHTQFEPQVYKTYGTKQVPSPNHEIPAFAFLPYDYVVSPTPSFEEVPAEKLSIDQREENPRTFPDLKGVYYFDRALGGWAPAADLEYYRFDPLHEWRRGGSWKTYEAVFCVGIPAGVSSAEDRAAYLQAYYEDFETTAGEVEAQLTPVVNRRIRIEELERKLNSLYALGMAVDGRDPAADAAYMEKTAGGSGFVIPEKPYTEEEHDQLYDAYLGLLETDFFADWAIGGDRGLVMLTTSIAAFENAPEAKPFFDNGWRFTLQEVPYSLRDMEQAQARLEAAAGNEIGEIVFYAAANQLMVHVEDTTEENRQRIAGLAGLEPLHITLVSPQ